MTVIGFDPGTNITGFGIIQKKNRDINYIKSGVVDLRKEKDIQKKLNKIYNKVIELIKIFSPESIAIEDVFVAKNTKGAIKLGYVKGIIFLASEHLNLKTYEYSPTFIKQAITGYGRATKEDIRRMLPNLIKNFQLNNFPDATDAIAIAYCHIMDMEFNNKIIQ